MPNAELIQQILQDDEEYAKLKERFKKFLEEAPELPPQFFYKQIERAAKNKEVTSWP